VAAALACGSEPQKRALSKLISAESAESLAISRATLAVPKKTKTVDWSAALALPRTFKVAA